MVTSLLVTRKCNICPIPDRFWVRFNIKILSNQYIGRSHDRLIFINGSPYTWNDDLHVKTEPRGQVLFLSLVSWWRHQMKTFSALLAFVRGIHRSPGNSPHKGQRHGAFMFSLICTWANGGVNNRDAGDLRRHRAHYDVIVMDFWLKSES